MFSLFRLSLLLLAFALAGCSSREQGPALALNLALTGPMAFWNTSVRDGVMAALDDYKASHPGAKVRVVVEDNRGEQAGAVAAITRLAGERDVVAAIATHSFLGNPQRAVAEKAGLPLVGTVNSTPGFGKNAPTTFLDFIGFEEVAPTISSFAAARGVKSAALIMVDDDYGRDGQVAFGKALPVAGIAVSGTELFGAKEADLRVRLTKLLAAKPGALVTVGRETSLVAVVKQARELGFGGLILGTNAFHSTPVISALAGQTDNLFFSGVAAEIDGADGVWAASIRRRGGEANWMSCWGYAMGQYLIPIVAESGGSRAAVAGRLAALDLETVRGRLVMGKDRRIPAALVMLALKDGKVVPAR